MSLTLSPLAISIIFNQGFCVAKGDHTNHEMVATINANMMSLGFVMTEELTTAMARTSTEELTQVYEELIETLQYLKGDQVTHKPMYAGFPEEVMEMSLVDLYINAVSLYWISGTWMPRSPELKKAFTFEHTKFISIGLSTREEFADIFTRLVTSNESLSSKDKTTVEWLLDNMADITTPTDIPCKENMCLVVGHSVKSGYSNDVDLNSLVKTATDVLRVATYLSGGDISLAERTQYKSLNRSTRKKLIGLLEPVATLEDLNRHRGKWVKLFHSFHVGDYSTKLYKMASVLRNNETVETFNSPKE